MSEKLITKEEWDAWLTYPCTKLLRKIAEKRREDLKEAWLLGNFADNLPLQYKAIGEGQCYAAIAQMDYDSLVLIELTESEDGPKPEGTSFATD